MGSKLGVHILGWTHWPELRNFVKRTQPAIIKVVGPTAHDTVKMAELKHLSPNSLWLYRHYLNEQPLDKPLWNAQKFIEKLNPYLEFYDIYEDYNEIDPRDHSFDPPKPLKVDTIKRYNEFSASIGSRLHAVGKQHLTGCWSNGQPPDGAWQYLKESLEVADYLSIHNYGWETLPDCPQFALRHRRIFDLLPVKKLMILSEVGITNAVFGGPDLGWRSWKIPPNLFAQEKRAAAVWAWFLDRINEDPYVVGANAYTTGRLKGDNWGSHDFTPRLYKLVGDYILGHPSPDPYLPNGGNDMETDSPLATWREGMPLGNYSKGTTNVILKTKIVLHSTDGTFTQAVNWFLNSESKVSAHYIIGRGHAGEPKIYQMVKESDIAHHAGNWGMNMKSIGIECVDDKLSYLTDSQRERLVALLKDIVKRYPHIEPGDIILHREVVSTKCPQAIGWDIMANILEAVFNEPAPDWEVRYKRLKGIVKDEIASLDIAIEGLTEMEESINRLENAIKE